MVGFIDFNKKNIKKNCYQTIVRKCDLLSEIENPNVPCGKSFLWFTLAIKENTVGDILQIGKIKRHILLPSISYTQSSHPIY